MRGENPSPGGDSQGRRRRLLMEEEVDTPDAKDNPSQALRGTGQETMIELRGERLLSDDPEPATCMAGQTMRAIGMSQGAEVWMGWGRRSQVEDPF